MSLGEMNAAIGEYETALKLNPLHCSAEFGLARALQRAGRVEEAHEHLKIFQHFTQAKISSPLSVGYGERGHYSTMEEMPLPVEGAGPMIPVKFEARELPGAQARRGTCRGCRGLEAGFALSESVGPGIQDLMVQWMRGACDPGVSKYWRTGRSSRYPPARLGWMRRAKASRARWGISTTMGCRMWRWR